MKELKYIIRRCILGDPKDWKKCIGCHKHKPSAVKREYNIKAANGLAVTSMGEICNDCFIRIIKLNI